MGREELVKWLRYENLTVLQMSDLMDEAADAIEELEKAVSRWTSVKEQLPKTRESILGKKSSKVIVAFRFDDGTQGTDTAHMLNGEWVFEDHIAVMPRTITHWMPLPEPPKEEYESDDTMRQM